MMRAQDILASNIKAYRKAAKLSQLDLSAATGLHRTYIGGIEQRRINVSLKNIEKIAAALGVSPAQLLQERDSTPEGEAHDLPAAQGAPSQDNPCETELYLVAVNATAVSISPIQAIDRDTAMLILGSLVRQGYAREEAAKHYEAMAKALEADIDQALDA